MKKTGTTVLQNYLKANVEVLKERGWKYPDFNGNRNHLNFAIPFQKKISAFHVMKGLEDPAGRQAFIDDLGAALEQRVEPGDRWVMTSEFFSSRLVSHAEVADVIAFFRQYFDKVTVVVFFRRQEFILPSTYSQSIKDGDSPRWGWPYCSRRLEPFDCLGVYDRWSAAVGPEHVIAIPYLESFKSDSLAVRRHFGDATGIEMTEEFHIAPSVENRSLTNEGIEFLRIINPRIPRLTKDRKSNLPLRAKAVARVMELTSDGDRFVPDGPTLVQIAEHYRTSNAELVRRLGGGPEWEEWLAQSFDPARTGSKTRISRRRLNELITLTSEPAGPVPPEVLKISHLRRRWGQVKSVLRETLREGRSKS
jgi:hypothetical protein